MTVHLVQVVVESADTGAQRLATVLAVDPPRPPASELDDSAVVPVENGDSVAEFRTGNVLIPPSLALNLGLPLHLQKWLHPPPPVFVKLRKCGRDDVDPTVDVLSPSSVPMAEHIQLAQVCMPSFGHEIPDLLGYLDLLICCCRSGSQSHR